MHSSVIVGAKINELTFELLSRVPHSPDLAHLDYFLFPNLNSLVKYFPTMKTWSLPLIFFGSYYTRGIQTIEHRWETYIELKRDYGKKIFFFQIFFVRSGTCMGIYMYRFTVVIYCQKVERLEWGNFYNSIRARRVSNGSNNLLLTIWNHIYLVTSGWYIRYIQICC